MITLFIGIIHYYMKLFGYENGILKDDEWYLACLILESAMELVITSILWEI